MNSIKAGFPLSYKALENVLQVPTKMFKPIKMGDKTFTPASMNEFLTGEFQKEFSVSNAKYERFTPEEYKYDTEVSSFGPSGAEILQSISNNTHKQYSKIFQQLDSTIEDAMKDKSDIDFDYWRSAMKTKGVVDKFEYIYKNDNGPVDFRALRDGFLEYFEQISEIIHDDTERAAILEQAEEKQKELVEYMEILRINPIPKDMIKNFGAGPSLTLFLEKTDPQFDESIETANASGRWSPESNDHFVQDNKLWNIPYWYKSAELKAERLRLEGGEHH